MSVYRGARRASATRPASSGGHDALASVTSLDVVSVALEGATVLAAFEVDEVEDQRRRALGAGAVTSTGLLHALWLLPSAIPVPIAAVPTVKRHRLSNAPSFVAVRDTEFERLYAPPGVVRAVGFAKGSAAQRLDRATRFTPIVQRFIVLPPPARPSRASVMRAEIDGIGVLVEESPVRIVVPAAQAEYGVPAVYRWWLAELAYERWLMKTPSRSAEPSGSPGR